MIFSLPVACAARMRFAAQAVVLAMLTALLIGRGCYLEAAETAKKSVDSGIHVCR